MLYQDSFCQGLVSMINFVNLFYYLVYFWYYLWILLYFFILFISLIILFQLIFSFIYSAHLDSAETCIQVLLFFFLLYVNSKITWFYCVGDKKYCLCTVHVLFMYCLCTIHRFHNTIHTFKNYFTTVFSVFNFQFHQ